jgi:gamma-glutamyltranspeptidase/glutathione hydrolase
MTQTSRRCQQVLVGSVAAAAIVTSFTGCSMADRARPTRGGAGPLYAAEARSDYGMVSTGSMEATEAGVWALERGGNAVDAAVAAAFTLGVSDPGGSGLGGLTYVLISTADGRDIAVDGSTPAPYVVDHKELEAIKESKGRFGYTVVSVPTTLATLVHSLEKYGTMELSQVLQPAIACAARGYRLSPNSVAWARGYMEEILASNIMRFIVLEDGQNLGRPGDTICSPDLHATLLRIASDGAETFYRGAMAAEIDADMQTNGGYLRSIDLARYRVREAEPLKSRYREAEILVFPPPGGGGEVVETLNILGTYPSATIAEYSAERLHIMIEATRLAQADQVGVSASANPVFGSSILDPAHARERATLIAPGRAIPESELGPRGTASALGDHTTQVSVIDRDGNVVSLTQTLCRQFGSKVATAGLGFPYNSCLEFLDFENLQSPLYLQPGGTFPTNMAPTIVRTPESVIALGSAGSDRIPPSVCEVITNLVDRHMDVRDAVVAPRAIWNSAHDPGRVCIEVARPIVTADVKALRQMGFDTMYVLRYPPDPVADSAFFGGVNVAAYNSNTGVFTGVGDPRRDGSAFGPRVAVVFSTRN